MDEGAIFLDVAPGEKSEDLLVHAGERLDARPVQAEDVVSADVLVVEEGVGGVLDAHAGRVLEAGEPLAALPIGQVPGGGVAGPREGHEPGRRGAGQ
ncbi:hypothetical protein [Streptomyces sp. NBC_00233]|uniref:hypothetical protein n=1 Tax=Streptomyces sp. NBC_00233 TaxID=2975686 RepID=UPI00224D25A1|nr:hypothetical protein [Streptomyces sp. NBC_00233]MCX5229543.1 hypothetical protein [Streptomyces sp. NBC_00233]